LGQDHDTDNISDADDLFVLSEDIILGDCLAIYLDLFFEGAIAFAKTFLGFKKRF
jgi:hypothetical protein